MDAESLQLEKVELHEMERIDGLMKMRALPELLIPSKGVELLKPEGKHLMLEG